MYQVSSINTDIEFIYIFILFSLIDLFEDLMQVATLFPQRLF